MSHEQPSDRIKSATRQSIYFEEGAESKIAAFVFVFLCGNYSCIQDHKRLLKATKWEIIDHNADN